MWDPQQYLKFANERHRPFLDLLGQIPPTELASIADLGCGPGLFTRALAERWLTAKVVGVDNSSAMLAQASVLAVPERLEFIEADLSNWTPDTPIDLIVSNAAIHWVDNHGALLTRLVQNLSPRGILAVQIPNSFADPGHQAVEEIIAQPRWHPLLHGLSNHAHVQPVEWYTRKLLELGLTANAWETVYVHVLSGANPVLEWLKGTTLRPILQKLSATETTEFLRELADRLSQAYPPQGNITLFPFRRLFFVGSKKAAQQTGQ